MALLTDIASVKGERLITMEDNTDANTINATSRNCYEYGYQKLL